MSRRSSVMPSGRSAMLRLVLRRFPECFSTHSSCRKTSSVATKLIYHEKDLSHIATQSDRVLLDSPSRSQLAHSALRCLFPGLLFSPFAGAAPAGGVVERSNLRVCPLSHRALCSGAALLLFSCCCLSGVIGGGVAVSPSAQKPPAGPPPSPCSRGCLVKLRSVVVLWICIRTAFSPLGLRLRPPPAASGRLQHRRLVPKRAPTGISMRGVCEAHNLRSRGLSRPQNRVLSIISRFLGRTNRRT